MLGQEPHVQTVLNVRENQDVQEDLQEIDIGGTHHPTGVENEGEEEPLELLEDIATDQEAVIEVDQGETEEVHQELHHLEGEPQLQPE